MTKILYKTKIINKTELFFLFAKYFKIRKIILFIALFFICMCSVSLSMKLSVSNEFYGFL